MINDIFKPRSCSSCINAALNVYSNYFKKIFKATWLYILLLSIVQGLSAFIASPIVDNASQAQSSIMPLLEMGAIFVAILLLDVRITSGVVVMLNEAPLMATMKKVLKANLLSIALYIIICMVTCGAIVGVAQIGAIQKLPQTAQITIFALFGILLLFVEAMVFSPFIYSATRYIFDKGASLKEIFGKHYRKGFHKIGFLFSLLLSAVLISMVVCMFLCVPACITIFASNYNSYGVANGDISGLPTYFSWLNFLSTTLMAFITQYLSIWIMLSFVYGYGSIEGGDNAENKKLENH